MDPDLQILWIEEVKTEATKSIEEEFNGSRLLNRPSL